MILTIWMELRVGGIEDDVDERDERDEIRWTDANDDCGRERLETTYRLKWV
jgi:hypothetical protein